MIDKDAAAFLTFYAGKIAHYAKTSDRVTPTARSKRAHEHAWRLLGTFTEALTHLHESDLYETLALQSDDLKKEKEAIRRSNVAALEHHKYLVKKNELDDELKRIAKEELKAAKGSSASRVKRSSTAGTRRGTTALNLAAATKAAAPVARKTTRVASKAQPKRAAVAKRLKLKVVAK